MAYSGVVKIKLYGTFVLPVKTAIVR